jgi:hypothetical protein
MEHAPKFQPLIDFLGRVPAIGPANVFGSGDAQDGWWIKFALDIRHRLAWNVVQELGHVLNYLSVEEPLPTVFKPVSPPPYMNGGPDEFLSWVIEAPASMEPATVAQWLEGRLPRPADDEAQWTVEDDD